MAELSGRVAILAAPGGAGAAIIEVRDLGPAPVPIKSGRAIPLTDVKPALNAGEGYGDPVLAHNGIAATRTYPVITLPTPPQIDQAALNAELAADGSIVRGLALVMLDEINALRTQAGLAVRTQANLKNAIQAKMR